MKKLPIVILLCVLFATMVLVFGNSLQETASSWRESDAFAELFAPLFQLLYKVYVKVATLAGVASPVEFGVFVRKLAHFGEYFLLGAECVALTAYIVKEPLSPYLWADLFIPLAIAVVDEYIQSFVGRTSLVADILLDYLGALVGIIVALVIALLVKRRRSAA